MEKGRPKTRTRNIQIGTPVMTRTRDTKDKSSKLGAHAVAQQQEQIRKTRDEQCHIPYADGNDQPGVNSG
jgi:hypothetical protein